MSASAIFFSEFRALGGRRMTNPLRQLPRLWRSYVLLFDTANRIICGRLEEEMARDRLGIGPREGWILMAAEELPLSQGLIAEVLGINANVMVRLVDGLETKGLLKRVKNRQNRRESQLVITATGKRLLKTMYRGWEKRTAKIFAPISSAELKACEKFARDIIADDYEKRSTPRKQ